MVFNDAVSSAEVVELWNRCEDYCRQGIGTVTPLFDEYEDWKAWRKSCSISPVHCKHHCICVHVI